jgi:hypothetical protein
MPSPSEVLSPDAVAFYRATMDRLDERGIPFLVGGAYAYARFTGIVRQTKDFDLFLLREDLEAAFDALAGPECETEITCPHWLAKAHCGACSIDLIFATGNGVSRVDEAWFRRAREGTALGRDVLLCSPEDMIWTKAFIQERERYDGADVAHLILKADLDWRLLMDQFRPHWRVLLSHLLLFDFAYPSERDRIPPWVMEDLLFRARLERRQPEPQERVCNGTLLSRAQYLVDTEEWGFTDGRLQPHANLSRADVRHWTAMIDADVRPNGASGED